MTPAGAASTTPDQLIAELHRLGIRHLATTTPFPNSVPLTRLECVTRLAASPDARVRSALIPLFIIRPDYASVARTASAILSGRARNYLKCGYSAAVALEQNLADTLAAIARPETPPLPDLFADELGLTALDNPLVRLDEVAKRHAELSGQDINWRGTYQHATATALRFALPVIP